MTDDVAVHGGSPDGQRRSVDTLDDVRTYYGRPVVKPPEWTWEVPWYLFFGGLAGASSVLTVVARFAGHDDLARRARMVAGAAATASPPLLVADLGRPARFLNMLRVFKPTSVMSVGSWVLAAYSGAALGAVGLATLDRLPRLRPVADTAAGVLGTAMSTYTGALVADTAIPVWHEARRELPGLFASSSVASAGAAASLATPHERGGPARRAALIGAVGELVVDILMRRRLGAVGGVYDEGPAGRFHTAASTATAVGATLLAAGRRRPPVAALGSVGLLVGGACQRWAVYKAGFQSAEDPRATIAPQRARIEQGTAYRDGGHA